MPCGLRGLRRASPPEPVASRFERCSTRCCRAAVVSSSATRDPLIVAHVRVGIARTVPEHRRAKAAGVVNHSVPCSRRALRTDQRQRGPEFLVGRLAILFMGPANKKPLPRSPRGLRSGSQRRMRCTRRSASSCTSHGREAGVTGHAGSRGRLGAEDADDTLGRARACPARRVERGDRRPRGEAESGQGSDRVRVLDLAALAVDHERRRCGSEARGRSPRNSCPRSGLPGVRRGRGPGSRRLTST